VPADGIMNLAYPTASSSSSSGGPPPKPKKKVSILSPQEDTLEPVAGVMHLPLPGRSLSIGNQRVW
jgi:hypothetical protein